MKLFLTGCMLFFILLFLFFAGCLGGMLCASVRLEESGVFRSRTAMPSRVQTRTADELVKLESVHFIPLFLVHRVDELFLFRIS